MTDLTNTELDFTKINFPDLNFKKYLLEILGKKEESAISKTDALAITKIKCPERNIISLEGIEYFKNLIELDCHSNKIVNLDIKCLSMLRHLNCSHNQISVLDFDTSLNSSTNKKLVSIDCSFNDLSKLEICNIYSFETLLCQSNKLIKLSLFDCNSLSLLNCSDNLLSKLNIILYETEIHRFLYSNRVSRRKIKSNLLIPALKILSCHSNKLIELDINNFISLSELDCHSNHLKSLDTSKNTFLIDLNCESNQLTTLNLYRNTNILKLNCKNNLLTLLDISNNILLTTLKCNSNLISSILVWERFDILNFSHLEKDFPKFLTKFYIHITDLNFKKYLLLNFDKDEDGEISYHEALSVKVIDCSLRNLLSQDKQLEKITSLEGLDNFINLTELNCVGNEITELDISNNKLLERLECGDNKLISLDVSNNLDLIVLSCSSNNLSEIDISNNIVMTSLSCDYNSINNLSLAKNINLKNLYCPYNNLSELNITENHLLTFVYCSHNKINNLNIESNTILKKSIVRIIN